MKFFKKHLFSLIAVVATLVATSVASSACWWFVYQPEEPKCLRDK
ncbi:cyclic lactone autoinducer peptide [Clostridium lacusfryxellense]|nr:cyclic lactone autoinducer peptide [Clostridium lacusfryxellense]MBU3112996.1 cyclic lactone autoinducer peptide [Clostridium lacusfryxellense]